MIPGEKPGTRRRSLQAIWKRIREAAEIPDVRIHDLRHTFASYGVNGGQNLAVVGRLLGHTKITTTQRYAHLADDSIRHASDAIGSDLAAAAGKPAVSGPAERLLPEARAPAAWWQRAIEAFGDLVSWRRWQWRETQADKVQADKVQADKVPGNSWEI